MTLPDDVDLEKEICYSILYAADGMNVEEAEAIASVVCETITDLLNLEG